LIVPYTLDANDMIVALNGFTEGEQFFRYLKDLRSALREARRAKMMSIGLHVPPCRSPRRARAVARFLDYVRQAATHGSPGASTSPATGSNTTLSGKHPHDHRRPRARGRSDRRVRSL
jgi:hypothetical protein